MTYDVQFSNGCSGIMLPWWSVYVAWSLNCLMVIVCGFFTILYSFEFGKERSNRWLLELCLSFVQNILIIQDCFIEIRNDRYYYVSFSLIILYVVWMTQTQRNNVKPLKVLCVSLAIATLLRKIDNSFLDTVEPEEIQDEDKRFIDMCSIQDEHDAQPLIAPKDWQQITLYKYTGFTLPYFQPHPYSLFVRNEIEYKNIN